MDAEPQPRVAPVQLGGRVEGHAELAGAADGRGDADPAGAAANALLSWRGLILAAALWVAFGTDVDIPGAVLIASVAMVTIFWPAASPVVNSNIK